MTFVYPFFSTSPCCTKAVLRTADGGTRVAP
jgi:hypothetical protein